MGLRFRKSINLGGGVKINLSKSGVGYSFGGKGYRFTKKAGGGTRTTTSIHGTGLSYVHENSARIKKNNRHGMTNNTNVETPKVPNTIDYTYDTQEIKNANVEGMVSEGLEEMLATANQSLKYYSWCAIGFFASLILGLGFPALWLVSVVCAIGGIWLNKNATINLEYTFEDDKAEEVAKRMAPLQKIARSKKIWYISQTSKVFDKKHSAGASNSVKRNICKASFNVPFPFKTNATAVCFKVGKETLVFLPDKLFVFQRLKIGALNYTDVRTEVHGQRFIESEKVPKDAKIVDYTWQYVNKSGGPDKRFQNNERIPICLYGEMEVRSSSGLNTDIMFSNINIE